MASGETLPRSGATHGAGTSHAKTFTGVVVVAHGGQSASTDPTNALQPAVLRMIPVAAAIRKALRGSGAVVLRPRFELRGWNGDQASPVADLLGALDGIAAAYGPIPVVLIGHSMGARAAMRAAGHPAVSAVAGLAPWLPLGEPVEQLAGRRVLVAHGTADSITSPGGDLGLRRARPGGHPGGRHRGPRRRPPDAAPRAPLACRRRRIRPRRPRPGGRGGVPRRPDPGPGPRLRPSRLRTAGAPHEKITSSIFGPPLGLLASQPLRRTKPAPAPVPLANPNRPEPFA